MRADERQAAVAYAYAWWMTGDEDAAATALRQALAAPDPDQPGDEARVSALVRGIRGALGDLRAMPPASEVALLHDGFGVPLDVAAEVSAVPTGQAAGQLATGRMDALLETVREDFRHPERLGGIALGAQADVEHALECRSCGRARVLIERGRDELQQVSSVSAPPGLLAQLVAEAAPPEPEAPPAEAPAPADAGDTVAVHEILEGPGEYEAAGDEGPAGRDTLVLPPDEIVLDEPGVDVAPAVEPEAPPESPPEPEDEQPRAPMPPGRRRTAGLLAGAGIVTASVLVAVLVASGGEEEPAPAPPTVDETEPTASEPPRPRRTEPTEDPFGPPGGERPGFAVTSAGLLLSGQEEMAPSGTTIDPQEPLRIAVAYENANRGIELRALWRVGDEVFERLETLVSSRASRHVWGVPVPEDGWPRGNHRIVITADDSVAGAIDFTVE